MVCIYFRCQPKDTTSTSVAFHRSYPLSASCSYGMVYPYLNQNPLLFHWKFSEEIQVQMEKICTLILHLFLLDVVEMEAVIILVNILKYLNTDGDTLSIEHPLTSFCQFSRILGVTNCQTAKLVLVDKVLCADQLRRE
ncbi:hypothetical protein RHGRI_028356 [Rhododendron griersonianum]|uniref:Uncharacterized protein n=1 Tax=Rhododendron griersonianum TaxID=479676 RepID=A0AAV6IHV9_9ERIC|nr:hypothetical protein RHGRI_028356 [Rhododendron griersonianum]